MSEKQEQAGDLPLDWLNPGKDYVLSNLFKNKSSLKKITTRTIGVNTGDYFWFNCCIPHQ